MSRMAFSVAAFSISRHPSSRFSAVHTCTIWFTAVLSGAVEPASMERRWLPIDTRRGSLHVTSASDPARCDTMRCAALIMRSVSGSSAKSLRISSRVVMQAMVQLRSTTGWMISRIARSTATGTRRMSCGCSTKSESDAFTFTYADRFGITVSPAPVSAPSPPAPSATTVTSGVGMDAGTSPILTLKSGLPTSTGLRRTDSNLLGSMSVTSSFSALHSTSTANLRFSLRSGSSYSSRSVAMRAMIHGLGGLITLLSVDASRILATKGTHAMRRPVSYASKSISLRSMYLSSSGRSCAIVILPSHSPRFFSRLRSCADDLILSDASSLRTLSTVHCSTIFASRLRFMRFSMER
mmetsp:Transcript_25005/g.87171  ORF Transcript_25005/g.87171 Transcript_25005/m.87171 type:complete len:352 (-) Transcript_25005:830-1885(-)